jgi:ABC-type glutathione transport system ATPase component
MPFLEVDHLSVIVNQPTVAGSFALKKVVDDVSFKIHPGEVVACIGSSGAGKSSLIQALLRIELPDSIIHYSGSISFLGAPLTTPKVLSRYRGSEISLVFQDPSSVLNPIQNIGDQIDEVLLLHTCLREDQRLEKVLQVMTLVGLTPAKEVYSLYPHQCSGGMKQRAVIAASLILDPKLIIADEPTTALDPPIQREIIEMIMTRVRRDGAAFFVVTHDLALVEAIADRVLVLADGKIVESIENFSLVNQCSGEGGLHHLITRQLVDSWNGLSNFTAP